MTLVLLADALRTGSLAILATVLQASLEAAAVATGVFVICRAMPALPARVRVWMWWLVCAKLLVGVLPVPSVPLALMPPPIAVWGAGVAADDGRMPRQPPPVAAHPPGRFQAEPQTQGQAKGQTRGQPQGEAPLETPRQAHSAAADLTPITIPYSALWPTLLVCAWLGVIALHAAGLVRALGRVRYLRRHTEPAPAAVVMRLAQLVRAFRLAVRPGVFASRLTAVPLLTGIFRPTILLPAATQSGLSRNELDLVLGHELAHVRRGDLVWGWVPVIAGRLFFFHPLARLAAREYLAAREEACDAEVLQTVDVEPAEYGRLLVKIGVATTDDVLAAAGSSPTFAMLKRRLIMLDCSRTPASRWWWTLAGATAVLLPLTLVAQPVVPRVPAAPVHVLAVLSGSPAVMPPRGVPPAPPVPPEVPAVPVVTAADDQDVAPPPPPPAAPAAPVAPVPQLPPVAVAPPAPPVPPSPAAAPAPPTPPVPPASPSRRTRDHDSPWVLLEPGSHNVMAGSQADREAAQKHRRAGDDTLLWFRRHGVEYVSRDAATLQAVRDAFVPVQVVGDEMGRGGQRMGARGGAQGALGAQQGELGARQGTSSRPR